LKKLRRYILRRWIETGRKPTLVICQQAVEEWLKASGLPKAIAVEHFNAIAGLDQYRDVRLLIAIGRTQPDPSAHEADAGALTGLEPIKAGLKANGSRWFDKVERGIRIADGSGRAVTCDQHPDPVCEALRQQICEAEILQSVGRARGVNRTAANPVDIDIVADVVLPLTVNEVLAWETEDVNEGIEMAAAGVVLGSPADMAKCWPEMWATPKAAECAVADFPLHSLVKGILTRIWRGKSPLTPPGLFSVTARPAAGSKRAAPPSTRRSSLTRAPGSRRGSGRWRISRSRRPSLLLLRPRPTTRRARLPTSRNRRRNPRM